MPRTPAPVFEGEWTPPRTPTPPSWPVIVGGVIGRVFGGIAGVLFPSETGDSELSEAQKREAVERYEELSRGPMPPLPRGAAERGFGDITHSMPRPAPDFPIPRPAPAIELPPVIVTAPAPVPTPTPTPRPSSSSSSTPRPSRARVPQPLPNPNLWPWDLIGSVIAGQIFNPTARSTWTLPSSATSSPTSTPAPSVDPLTPPRPTSGIDPLTSSPTSPLTGFNTRTLSSTPPRVPTSTRTDTDRDRCRCKPKKRKKPRKCVARAGLRWVGGPKSGELAGSRCYAFTNTRK